MDKNQFVSVQQAQEEVLSTHKEAMEKREAKQREVLVKHIANAIQNGKSCFSPGNTYSIIPDMCESNFYLTVIQELNEAGWQLTDMRNGRGVKLLPLTGELDKAVAEQRKVYFAD